MLAFHFPYSEQTNQKMEEQMMYSKAIPENMEVDEECEVRLPI